MRITIVVNDGAELSETFIRSKAAGLTAHGFDVTILAVGRTRRTPKGTAADVVQSPIGLRGWRRAAGYAQLLARHPTVPTNTNLRALPILATKPDIVNFAFSGIAAAYLDTLDALRPARIVVSCRGAAEQIAPLVDPTRADRLQQVFAKADAVHCVSDDMRRTVVDLGAPPDKTFVNRPAIDVSAFTPATTRPPHDPFVLGSIGRLHWKKGLPDAIAAVKDLTSNRGRKVVYRIVGTGPEDEHLRFLAQADDAVEFLGPLPPHEVRRHLSTFDAFLLPSLSEGISNSALEAMASGVPVIATRVGGMGEAIDDGENGLLVDPGNPSQLADAVERLMDVPALADKLAANARQTVEQHFTLERQAAVFADVYTGLLKRHP